MKYCINYLHSKMVLMRVEEPSYEVARHQSLLLGEHDRQRMMFSAIIGVSTHSPQTCSLCFMFPKQLLAQL